MTPFDRQPADWQDLQTLVGQLFEEVGCEVSVGMTIELVRGRKEIDVHVRDTSQFPPSLYLCECKLWSKAVDQDVVHGFRTVVADAGAHRGYVVSKVGFQSGAVAAAQNTNIDLVTFDELQRMFFDRWLSGMEKRTRAVRNALFPYWDVSGGKGVPDGWGAPQQRAMNDMLSTLDPFIALDTLQWHPSAGLRLPISVTVLDDKLIPGGTLKLETPRQFFDYVDQYGPVALNRYKRLFQET